MLFARKKVLFGNSIAINKNLFYFKSSSKKFSLLTLIFATFRKKQSVFKLLALMIELI